MKRRAVLLGVYAFCIGVGVVLAAVSLATLDLVLGAMAGVMVGVFYAFARRDLEELRRRQ